MSNPFDLAAKDPDMIELQPMTSTAAAITAGDAAAYREMRRALAALGYTQPTLNSRGDLSDLRHIYFIMSGDLVKVGIATDVARRLHGLRAGAPRGLTLRGTREVPAIFARQIERKVHEALAHVAIGREWFTTTPKDARAVADPIVRTGWRAFRIYSEQVPWV